MNLSIQTKNKKSKLLFVSAVPTIDAGPSPVTQNRVRDKSEV